MSTTNPLAQWRRDPCAFIESVLHDPETSQPFKLYPAQREFIRRGFTLDAKGRLPFRELLMSAGKKSGKTATGALLGLYTAIVIAGKFGEIYCLANDLEQAQSRVFQACSIIVQASPMLKGSATITRDKIVFPASGSFIQACASDYAGFAGANPSLVICDEPWAYTSEGARRLFDEAVPSPARKVSARLSVSYAGFEGEPSPLTDLYKRGVIEGTEIGPDLYESPGMLACWRHTYEGVPWVTSEWIEESRRSLRPSQFLRMIRNEWVTSESGFLPMEDFDGCVNPALTPVYARESLPVWVGVDASVKRDATAACAVTYDYSAQKILLVDHKIFTPKKDEPVNFAALEDYLLGLRSRFAVRQIVYDPYQFESVSQRLAALGLPLEPYPQTLPNLEATSSALYDLFRFRRISLYPDAAIRMAMSHTVAVETTRGGTRISKSRASHHIDIIAALSFACLMCVREGSYAWSPGWIPASAAPSTSPAGSLGGRFLADGSPDYAYTTGESAAEWEDSESTRTHISSRYRGMYGVFMR